MDWEIFKQKFFVKSNIDLNNYKPAQMQRRITNLMNRNGANTYMGFFELLEKDPKLYKDFIDYLTINVTEFFRTPEKFVELEDKVIPDMLKQSSRLFNRRRTIFVSYDLNRYQPSRQTSNFGNRP